MRYRDLKTTQPSKGRKKKAAPLALFFQAYSFLPPLASLSLLTAALEVDGRLRRRCVCFSSRISPALSFACFGPIRFGSAALG